jgi:hypothetical protein
MATSTFFVFTVYIYELNNGWTVLSMTVHSRIMQESEADENSPDACSTSRTTTRLAARANDSPHHTGASFRTSGFPAPVPTESSRRKCHGN